MKSRNDGHEQNHENETERDNPNERTGQERHSHKQPATPGEENPSRNPS
jgi:hypothetical protein